MKNPKIEMHESAQVYWLVDAKETLNSAIKELNELKKDIAQGRIHPIARLNLVPEIKYIMDIQQRMNVLSN